MTWSIVARDDDTGYLGCAAATRFFAVGARVPFVASGTGAIATQGLVNPYYGIDGLKFLGEGHEPVDVLTKLTCRDPGEEHRQAHLVDMRGRSAAHTGTSCLPWSGHICRPGVSVAGNMLAGERVLRDTLDSYRHHSQLPFAARLIAAMRAGEAAGGDRRGRQSASLIIFGPDEWSVLDLRVDDHADPLEELQRLEVASRREWMIYRRFVPTRQDPGGVTDHSVIDAAVGSSGEQV
ncbi:DUF1028 domain-containing protein [Bradyrhizobium sp. URHA0013]|jgi:uncharacterized Ntn-hydrolase superfamily protein|uniref:DUF1028 domain-containing protein n=1 Tax=Bradyrhizobium sp. URHA0013 TaxID=1380352 RepID=UPI00048A1D3B|nr:DUF1028 domain-containing protein [Bradyrhizobium sp. URHA0013]